MENLKYSEILKANNLKKKEVEDIRPYRIKVLSNITCNQLSSTLSFHLYNQKVNPIVEFGNYDNIIQDSFSVEGYDLIIVHYDLLNILDKNDCYYEDYTDEQLSELEDNISQELGLILNNISKVPCAIIDSFTSLSIPHNPLRVNKLKKLSETLNSFVCQNKGRNTYFIDIDCVINKIGVTKAFDFKLYTLSKTLYTIDYWKEYTYTVSPALLKNTGHPKKAIIFDCDNTLWKGILGEDGINGIDMNFHSKIGSIYHEVQQIAVWLSKHGVIVGLCSKNNFEDVQEVLEKHPDMALKSQNIVVSEINWNDKASNLKLIAEELNIGLDSILFVDDSSFEINLVREQIPQVECLQVPEAIFEYPNKLMEFVNRYFFFSDSKDDLNKTEQYKQQANRNKLKAQFNDIESFLKSLEIQIEIQKNHKDDIDRISQLTQKTNQFNLCTNRYTSTQIEELMNDSQNMIYSISVKDKFGDSGLTAVSVVSYHNEKAVIKDFLMSCRIMGRNIEYSIIEFIIKELSAMGVQEVAASYIQTAKNKPVANFYETLGMQVVSEVNGNKNYLIKTENFKYKNISYIQVI